MSIIIISLSWQHLPSSSSFCGGQQQCMRCTTTRKRFSDGKNVRAGNKSGHKPTCLLTLKIFCWILAASLNAAAQIELEKLCMVNYGQAWTIVCYCFWNNYYFWSTFMMVSFLQRCETIQSTICCPLLLILRTGGCMFNNLLLHLWLAFAKMQKQCILRQ